jgi:ribose transport system substrate-binding protein
VAEVFGIRLESLNADYSPELQSKQVDKAIHRNPDLIILTPTSVDKSTGWFRKINSAGIPVVGSNTTPTSEGFRYLLSWTGPDDWAQFRLLAGEFAQRMNRKGGYCILRHKEGNSNYYSRTYGILTELKKIAPEMECLDMIPGISEKEAYTVASNWLKNFGDRLKGITFSDPADGVMGVCRAVKESGRDDIVIVSSGNSLVTQDLVKGGSVHAITYQSAEADGALAVETAVDFFNGLDLPPVRYLPQHIITSADVHDFYPSQW